MKRRTFFRVAGLGALGTALSLVHPRSRKILIRTYKTSTIQLTPPYITRKKRAQLNLVFNFASKSEEKEILGEIAKLTKKQKLQTQKVLLATLKVDDFKHLILQIEKRRWDYAHKLLTRINESNRTDRMRKLTDFFKSNRQKNRVPSQAEIEDIVNNGAEYQLQ